jgi:hypothetical protein
MPMEILENTLEIQTERWEDPGDYPSAAGSFALPSSDYVEGVAGHVKFKLEGSSEPEILNALLNTVELELPEGVKVTGWNFKIEDGVVTAEVSEFDASKWEPPDYEPYDSY